MIYIFAATLMACGSQKSENGNQLVADTTAVVADTVAPKDSLAMVEEEDKLLKTLLPDLCSRKFPTAEEMKMWDLVIDKDVEYKKLPVLARALVRAYFGKQFWGKSEEQPEVDYEKAAFYPAYGEYLGIGDIENYDLWADSVYASSISHNEGTKYNVKEICRSGLYKPWCSAVGKPEGESITCLFKLIKRPLNYMTITNGFCHTEKQWKNHGRIAKLQMLVDDHPIKTFTLEDTPKFQGLEFPAIQPKSDGTPVKVSFKILKVYPGAKYNDVSITLLTFASNMVIDDELDEESKESY